MPGFSELEVVKIIYEIVGKSVPPTVTQKVRNKKLEHLDYLDDHYDTLQIELDAYVNEIDAAVHVTDDEVGDCERVGDVLDLIEEKLP